MVVVRQAGREDVAVLTRLREEWAVEQMLNMLVFTRMPKPARRTSRWGYVRERSVPFYERAGFVPATSLMVNDLS